MLAMGDALAMVVLAERGFSREDYALYHPSGSIGRGLMRVSEVMRQKEELPLVHPAMKVKEVLVVMTRTKGRPGAALIVDEDRRLIGIFTDGDLRRLHEESGEGRLDLPVEQCMGRNPKAIGPDALVAEAERILREYQIDQIPVLDEERRPIGLLDVQDLLHTRL
jgi:arabinose-5-phosphate isomerase